MYAPARNADGSPYCLESVEEIVNGRCDQHPWPRLDDVLGSDWIGDHYYADAKDYRAAALRAARRLYDYSDDMPEHAIGAR
jgi:hypothetical protein